MALSDSGGFRDGFCVANYRRPSVPGEQQIPPKLNWRKALILSTFALIAGVSCLLWGLEANGATQIALLTGSAIAMFLFFAGIYVTLVRRYYYRQP